MRPQLPHRLDPESLLRSLKRAEEREGKGKLKIFFGMSAGVGKTYEMLLGAQEARKKGTDVVVGYVETHGRKETEALLEGLSIMPRISLGYRGTVLEEMDLDAILRRRPALVLVDELAHTNAPGSRHTKRCLDVLELLENGIDVYTTLNVQHLESRADTVAQITGAIVRETVPDSIFERADEVEVIDLPAGELLKRLAEGKVYAPERSQRAVQHFFRRENLTALREMALRLAAERVERQLRDYLQAGQIQRPWKSGQRLLVGVTPSRDSVHLIRWTRRLASAMQASWIAVFVERASGLGEAEKEQFARNIALARDLGAEVVTTADEDVAAALVRIAREENATQIVVGKSKRKPVWQKTLVDRLIDLSASADVYVTTGEGETDPERDLFHVPKSQSGPLQFAVATGIVLLVAGVCYPFADLIGYQTVSLVLLLTVVLLPLRLGVGPVLLAAALSALIWDYLFIPPRFTFVVRYLQDVLMLVAYFAVATVTGILTARVRAREKAVRSREGRATALYALTKDLASAKNQEEVCQAATANLRKFFNADIALFLSDPEGDFINTPNPASTFIPSEKELSVPAWVHWNEKRAGRFTETLGFAEATYYPLTGPRYPLGVIGVKPLRNEQLSIDEDTLLENFLSQISSAVDREFLNDITKQSIALAESERLYQTLFNSISHEIRTPITALLGAADSLMNEAVGGKADIRRTLAEEIQAAAERLDNIVQNLLAMTRLESGLIEPKPDWTDVRDVINSAAGKLGRELADHTLSVDVSPDVPLVRLDYPLIEQALVNLLRNAAIHTPAGSAVSVRAVPDGEDCLIVVADTGPGFPQESLPRIFEKFYRVPGSRTGGIGLGLSIARGFVEAHGGTISVENCAAGGAKFTVRLPMRQDKNRQTANGGPAGGQ